MSDRLRRLDALFAERVLGCKVVARSGDFDCACPARRHGAWDEAHLEHRRDLVRFTRCLDAAWEGAAKIGWAEVSGPFKGRGVYGARFEPDNAADHDSVGTTAPHPAEALVLACLRAVGVSEEEIDGTNTER